MRAIGQAERALELMCRRSLSREAFGKPLAQLGANYDIIAESRMKIEMARLLCLKAAYMMDTVGQRDASPWISQIKVIAPRIALEITDEAVQMHELRASPRMSRWRNVDALAHTAPRRRPRRGAPPPGRPRRAETLYEPEDLIVIPGLVPGIHLTLTPALSDGWIPATSAGMTRMTPIRASGRADRFGALAKYLEAGCRAGVRSGRRRRRGSRPDFPAGFAERLACCAEAAGPAPEAAYAADRVPRMKGW
jgi:hypothetical protein